jgi:signal transduction histidine kinase
MLPQRWSFTPFWFPRPMLWAIAATFCAAGLVLYFQHRAVSTLDAQTAVILRQVSEQTAADIAAEVLRTFEGPVFDTLTRVNHPELRAGRLDLVAERFAEGLAAYPHVERFVVWTEETDKRTRGEALFLERSSGRVSPADRAVARFTRDAALGEAILKIAHRYAPEQRIYVAGETGGASPARQVLLRLFWTDAERDRYFAVLGFVVDPARLGQQLFSALHARSVGPLLQRRGGNADLQLHVTDEVGRSVYGATAASPLIAAADVRLPLLIYPGDRIESRLSGAISPRLWRLEVTAGRAPNLLGVNHGYWPTILSVMLMLIALGLTVQAQRHAEDFSRMQADFISHVSHQLKTPLSLLSAVTETVTMDRVRSPEKLAEYVGIMRNEVSRLSVLVKRVLEFSRLEQQREYEFEIVDVSALAFETVSAFASSLSDLQFNFEADRRAAQLQVLADPAALEQVLINLLDNAVKYSGDAREVTVQVRSVAHEAVIDVSDRGVGISRTDQRRIFEKFFRGAGAARHVGGFGLGLPIAQQLVHAHNGRLEFSSVEGCGSTFRVILPVTSRRSAPGQVATDPLTDAEAVQ